MPHSYRGELFSFLPVVNRNKAWNAWRFSTGVVFEHLGNRVVWLTTVKKSAEVRLIFPTTDKIASVSFEKINLQRYC